jgi:hypothetical protein
MTELHSVALRVESATNRWGHAARPAWRKGSHDVLLQAPPGPGGACSKRHVNPKARRERKAALLRVALAPSARPAPRTRTLHQSAMMHDSAWRTGMFPGSPVENPSPGRVRRMFSREDRIQPLLDKLPPNTTTGDRAGLRRLRDLAVIPTLARLGGIGLQQNSRRARLAGADVTPKGLALAYLHFLAGARQPEESLRLGGQRGVICSFMLP